MDDGYPRTERRSDRRRRRNQTRAAKAAAQSASTPSTHEAHGLPDRIELHHLNGEPTVEHPYHIELRDRNMRMGPAGPCIGRPNWLK